MENTTQNSRIQSLPLLFLLPERRKMFVIFFAKHRIFTLPLDFPQSEITERGRTSRISVRYYRTEVLIEYDGLTSHNLMMQVSVWYSVWYQKMNSRFGKFLSVFGQSWTLKSVGPVQGYRQKLNYETKPNVRAFQPQTSLSLPGGFLTPKILEMRAHLNRNTFFHGMIPNSLGNDVTRLSRTVTEKPWGISRKFCREPCCGRTLAADSP